MVIKISKKKRGDIVENSNLQKIIAVLSKEIDNIDGEIAEMFKNVMSGDGGVDFYNKYDILETVREKRLEIRAFRKACNIIAGSWQEESATEEPKHE